MLLFGDLLGPYVLFVSQVQVRAPSTWGIKVDFPSTEIFGISWPCIMFAHQGNGPVLPCHLVVEGQVCHIGQIGPSPVAMSLNTLYSSLPVTIISIAQMEQHSIFAIWNDIAIKLASHFTWLVFWHQIPWTPHIQFSFHWKNTNTIGLINRFWVFNNKIKFHPSIPRYMTMVVC